MAGEGEGLREKIKKVVERLWKMHEEENVQLPRIKIGDVNGYPINLALVENPRTGKRSVKLEIRIPNYPRGVMIASRDQFLHLKKLIDEKGYQMLEILKVVEEVNESSGVATKTVEGDEYKLV